MEETDDEENCIFAMLGFAFFNGICAGGNAAGQCIGRHFAGALHAAPSHGIPGRARRGTVSTEELQGMGYEVRLHRSKWRWGGGEQRDRRQTRAKRCGILILSAHHDSVPTSFGANDNASGVAALLAAAQALAAVPSDTELRVISFTGEETEKSARATTCSRFPQQERERIIGDITV